MNVDRFEIDVIGGDFSGVNAMSGSITTVATDK
jgi:hypothetical protein